MGPIPEHSGYTPTDSKVRRWLRDFKRTFRTPGASFSPPRTPTPEFLEDVVYFTVLFAQGGTANGVHGQTDQSEMAEKYPRRWLFCLWQSVGRFSLD